MRGIRKWYSTVVSTLALAVALTGTAAYAGGLIGSNQIKNNSIKSVDLRKSSVKSIDLATSSVKAIDVAANAVSSSELSDGAVGLPEADLPDPRMLKSSAEAAIVGTTEYQKVMAVDAFTKEGAPESSELSAMWSVTVKAGFSPCVFQLRANGAPAAAGTSEVYVPSGGQPETVSAPAVFSNLAAGPVTFEVWARTTLPGGYPCTVSPSEAGVGQSVSVVEEAT